MKAAEPADLATDRVGMLLRESWQLEVDNVSYARVGHGSYHWIAARGDRAAWFVTADRLAGNRLRVLDASARVARVLADTGFEFVIAPVPDRQGSLVHVVDPGWGVQVSPYVAGASSDFGGWSDGTWPDLVEQSRIAQIVGRLHAYPAPEFVPLWDPTPPHWEQLNAALQAAEQPARAGSGFAERTHTLLGERRGRVLALMARYDDLVAQARSGDDPWVLTHGEPDSDNVIRTEDGRMHLIDWTTAAVAPRERDLFDVMQGPGDILDVYQRHAGRFPPRATALEMIGLHWRLSHLGHDLDLLLNQRRSDDDLERAWIRFLERLDRPPGRYTLH